MRHNKFGAKKTTINGIRFDSKWEATRWQQLELLQKAGKIAGLQRQVRFPLVVNGHLICTYIADFSWTDTETGERTISDAKSPATLTPEFRIKAKLLEALHGIVVQIDMAKPVWGLDTSKGLWRRQTRQPRSPRTSKRGAGSPASF